MEAARASMLARQVHAGHHEHGGTPLLWHLRRVALEIPGPMQALAWLHESLDAGISEQQLLTDGLTTDELRALRLLALPAIAPDGPAYVARIDFIARAGGWAGDLARAVKVADLGDRIRHPRARPSGWTPPYEHALERLLADLAGPSRSSLRCA